MGQRENKLERKEDKVQRQLRLGVAVLFLNTQSETDLYQNLGLLNRGVRSLIQDVEDEAVDLAADDTEQFTDFTAKPTNNKTRRAATAMSIVAGTVFLVDQYLKEKEYHAAVQKAILDQQARMDLIASTEFFHKYNEQYMANLSKEKGYFEWNALLDKRTCAKCSSLDGKQWDNAQDVPSIPVHPRCRCILNFNPQ